MLSVQHLIIIFVIALVVFGPQKLPELARILGKATAEFRRMTTDFRYALEQEVQELDRQVRIREEQQHAVAPQGPPGQPAGTQPRTGESTVAEVASPILPPQDEPNAVEPPPQEKSSEDHAA